MALLARPHTPLEMGPQISYATSPEPSDLMKVLPVSIEFLGISSNEFIINVIGA